MYFIISFNNLQVLLLGRRELGDLSLEVRWYSDDGDLVMTEIMKQHKSVSLTRMIFFLILSSNSRATLVLL